MSRQQDKNVFGQQETNSYQIPDTKQYFYDSSIQPWTCFIGAATPPVVARQLMLAQEAADTAARAMVDICHEFNQRYERLCPSTQSAVHIAHTSSIMRLINWRDTFLYPPKKIDKFLLLPPSAEDPPICPFEAVSPPPPPPLPLPPPRVPVKERHPADHAYLDDTLSPPAKIPISLLRGIVNHEPTYRKYHAHLTNLRDQFLTGPYLQWLMSKRRLEEVLIDSPINEMDRRAWLRWWMGYSNNMKMLEARVNEMVIPTWEEISMEINEILEVAVDRNFDWEEEFALPTVRRDEVEYADFVKLYVPVAKRFGDCH